MDSVTLALHTHLARHYGGQPLARNSGRLAGWQQVRVRDYMLAHLGQRLTLAELAAQAALSEYHFARMFRQSTGLAPHQYVMQRRMDRAQQMVRYTTQSLTDIALCCGFSSASHFSNRFKAVNGMTPSQLRAGLAG